MYLIVWLNDHNKEIEMLLSDESFVVLMRLLDLDAKFKSKNQTSDPLERSHPLGRSHELRAFDCHGL